MNKQQKLTKDPYGIKQLKNKDFDHAIIQHICEDFNLTPILAKAYYQQIVLYLNNHTRSRLKPGQLCIEAIDFEEPAGKSIFTCKRKAIVLNFSLASDLDVLLKQGIAFLRQVKIMRFTQEAFDQKTLLTHADLSLLLCASPATIKRDISVLRKQTKFIPTRGQVKDIGKGISHKSQIVSLYFDGYSFSEVVTRSHHSQKSVFRYLQKFIQVARLAEKKLAFQEIRAVAEISQKLLLEYLALLKEVKKDSYKKKRLKQMEQDINSSSKKGEG